MSHHIPEAGVWCLIVALAAVVVLLVRQRTVTTALRARAAALEENVRARDEEAARLVDVRLPAVADSMDRSEPLPGLLDERLTGTAFAHSLQAVMELFAQSVDKAQERADQSAKAALRASMRALQGLAHEQQQAITGMQERHDDPAVLRDLLEIDHTNSQFGRRAQAIGVLCGSWPGRQRVASPLTDVVRGATSRIRDYRRVRVHGDGELAVVSRAVEPVVLAVAELLDNAARHSQPNTTVEVSLQPVHNGACVLIDDAGVGMDGQEIERAVDLLSGRRAVDVSRLGDPPQFGFPVVGVLAARYGFSVSVDTRSPYGGVRAVVFLPTALLTHLELDGPGTTPLTAPRATGGGAARGRDRARGGPDGPAAGASASGGDGFGEPAPGRTPAPGAGGDRRPSVAGTRDSGQPVSRPSGTEGSSGTEAGSAPSQGPTPSAGTTAGGLPKRRRRRPAAPPAGSAPLPPETPAPAAPERTAEETARRMGAFARGTRSGRANRTPATPGAPTETTVRTETTVPIGTTGPSATDADWSGAGRPAGDAGSTAPEFRQPAEPRGRAADAGRFDAGRTLGDAGRPAEAVGRSACGTDSSAHGTGRYADAVDRYPETGHPGSAERAPRAEDRTAAQDPTAAQDRARAQDRAPGRAPLQGRAPASARPADQGPQAGTPHPYPAGAQQPHAEAPGPYAPEPHAEVPHPYPGAPQPHAEAPGPYAPQPHAEAPGPYAPDPHAEAPRPYPGTPAPYPEAPGPYPGARNPYPRARDPYPAPPERSGADPGPYPRPHPAPGPRPSTAPAPEPAEDEGNPHA
ncbi:ATP-binding protein [Streptomyces mobaraensis]|uniref:ATP-binding protein n=1 Tax=Streptomyces mobaraensis TaxID=35621 RepID=UPI003B969EDE